MKKRYTLFAIAALTATTTLAHARLRVESKNTLLETGYDQRFEYENITTEIDLSLLGWWYGDREKTGATLYRRKIKATYQTEQTRISAGLSKTGWGQGDDISFVNTYEPLYLDTFFMFGYERSRLEHPLISGQITLENGHNFEISVNPFFTPNKTPPEGSPWLTYRLNDEFTTDHPWIGVKYGFELFDQLELALLAQSGVDPGSPIHERTHQTAITFASPAGEYFTTRGELGINWNNSAFALLGADFNSGPFYVNLQHSSDNIIIATTKHRAFAGKLEPKLSTGYFYSDNGLYLDGTLRWSAINSPEIIIEAGGKIFLSTQNTTFIGQYRDQDLLHLGAILYF